MGETNLKYCLTNDVWADILTKPLQGTKFRQLRAVLMNCPVDYSEDPLMVDTTVNPTILKPPPQFSMKP